MQSVDYFTIFSILIACLGVLVAAIGVALVLLAWFEWRKIRFLQDQIEAGKKELRADIRRAIEAAHRVISSYGVKDPDKRIALLRSALQVDANAFNAWNGIGYAYLDKGDVVLAIDAFENAIHANMAGKADFCDLAYAQLVAGNEELALKYCRRAMEIDASARNDLLADERFAAIHKYL